MKNEKTLGLLSEEQRKIVKKSYFDETWATLNAFNLAGKVTLRNLSDASEQFVLDINKQILMTIAFNKVRQDLDKEEKKITKKRTKKVAKKK